MITVEAPIISTSSSHAERAAGINYFFAVMPDAPTRSDIAGVGERLRKTHRVSGTSVNVDNLHLTICPMGKPERLRQPLETALLAAAAEVCVKSFDAALDSVMRFSVRNDHFPLVLCADSATSAATLNLRKAIAAAQLGVGLQVSGVSSFLPHVTLLHGHAVDTIEESITPIHWRVSEFVLIRSFFGESRYEVVGRWPLAMEPEPEAHDWLDEIANLPELPDLPDDE